ncbi:hypothetical protein [Leptolyngbya sp. NIES-2104]|uniref:hypothetical protein n=1 Tax=Leptolyngbya sp. NIES-2104 TaxID=1552121 RepID=UPI00178D01D5|nr:hypothetical protein [Leptolyngbya sp. NIES-2104]
MGRFFYCGFGKWGFAHLSAIEESDRVIFRASAIELQRSSFFISELCVRTAIKRSEPTNTGFLTHEIYGADRSCLKTGCAIDIAFCLFSCASVPCSHPAHALCLKGWNQCQERDLNS